MNNVKQLPGILTVALASSAVLGTPLARPLARPVGFWLESAMMVDDLSWCLEFS